MKMEDTNQMYEVSQTVSGQA